MPLLISSCACSKSASISCICFCCAFLMVSSSCGQLVSVFSLHSAVPARLRLAAGFRPIVSGKYRKLPASSHFLYLPETARLNAKQIRHIGRSLNGAFYLWTDRFAPPYVTRKCSEGLGAPNSRYRYSSAVLVFYLQKMFHSPFPVKFRHAPTFICKIFFNDLLCSCFLI